MSPIDLLKEGIVAGSWPTVVAAYRQLTGDESVVVPQVSQDDDGFEQWKKDVLSQIQQMFDVEIVPPDMDKPSVGDGGPVDPTGNSNHGDLTLQTQKDGGLMVSDVPTPQELKENKALDSRRTPRRKRSTAKDNKAICSLCKKEYDDPIRGGRGEVGGQCKKCMKKRPNK